MLRLEDVVRLSLIRMGQLHFPLSHLNFHYEELERLFIQTIRDYENYRPKHRIKTVRMSRTNGYKAPDDFKYLISVKNSYSGFGFDLAAPKYYSEIDTGWFYENGDMIYPPYDGDFLIEYGGISKIEKIEERLGPIYIDESMTDIPIKLPSFHKFGSFYLSLGTLGNLVLRDDKVSGKNFSGSLGTAVFNEDKNELTLFVKGLKGELVGTYETRYKVALEYNDTSKSLIELFEANLMVAIGTAKVILRMDQLPIDIDLQAIADRGTTRLDELRASLGEKTYWWMWG